MKLTLIEINQRVMIIFFIIMNILDNSKLYFLSSKSKKSILKYAVN